MNQTRMIMSRLSTRGPAAQTGGDQPDDVWLRLDESGRRGDDLHEPASGEGQRAREERLPADKSEDVEWRRQTCTSKRRRHDQGWGIFLFCTSFWLF